MRNDYIESTIDLYIKNILEHYSYSNDYNNSHISSRICNEIRTISTYFKYVDIGWFTWE